MSAKEQLAPGINTNFDYFDHWYRWFQGDESAFLSSLSMRRYHQVLDRKARACGVPGLQGAEVPESIALPDNVVPFIPRVEQEATPPAVINTMDFAQAYIKAMMHLCRDYYGVPLEAGFSADDIPEDLQNTIGDDCLITIRCAINVAPDLEDANPSVNVWRAMGAWFFVMRNGGDLDTGLQFPEGLEGRVREALVGFMPFELTTNLHGKIILRDGVDSSNT